MRGASSTPCRKCGGGCTSRSQDKPRDSTGSSYELLGTLWICQDVGSVPPTSSGNCCSRTTACCQLCCWWTRYILPKSIAVHACMFTCEINQPSSNFGQQSHYSFFFSFTATPADVSLLMQLGVDGVFVGSGIFKSADPPPRAKAMVQAVTHYRDAALLAQVSENLGEPMVSVEAAFPGCCYYRYMSLVLVFRWVSTVKPLTRNGPKEKASIKQIENPLV